MQSTVQDRIDAEFVLKKAKQEIQFEELNDLKPEMLHGLFGILRTEENRRLILEGVPQERVRVIETKLKKIRDELLPQMGKRFLDSGKQLTRKPTGRPQKMPADDVCCSVCRFIADLNTKEKVGIVTAQKRAAAKWSIGFRTIERIWSRRHEFLADNEAQSKDG